MSKSNILSEAPPYAVEQALRAFSANLKTARLRRNLTIKNVAERIGTGIKAVRDAEHGKATTSVSVYLALLWCYDLLHNVEKLADPLQDKTGLLLSANREPKRSRSKKVLDNDF